MKEINLSEKKKSKNILDKNRYFQIFMFIMLREPVRSYQITEQFKEKIIFKKNRTSSDTLIKSKKVLANLSKCLQVLKKNKIIKVLKKGNRSNHGRYSEYGIDYDGLAELFYKKNQFYEYEEMILCGAVHPLRKQINFLKNKFLYYSLDFIKFKKIDPNRQEIDYDNIAMYSINKYVSYISHKLLMEKIESETPDTEELKEIKKYSSNTILKF